MRAKLKFTFLIYIGVKMLTDENMEFALTYTFGKEWRHLLDMRSLQSIAVFMRLPINTKRSSFNQLLLDIGNFLYDNPGERAMNLAALRIIANSPKMDVIVFKFLHDKYSAKLIAKKLTEFNVFGKYVTASEFHRDYSRDLILTSLSDSCTLPMQCIIDRLVCLEKNIKEMRVFERRVAWFKDEDPNERLEKLNAAVDYFGKNNIWTEAVFDEGDLEVYFYTTSEEFEKKINVYEKIRSIYNNRKSRRLSKRVQRGFLIDKKSDNLINDLSKKYRTTKSIILEVIFNSSNRDILVLLFEEGVKKLAIPVGAHHHDEELK